MSEINPTGITRPGHDEETEVVRSLFGDEQAATIDEELEKPREGPMSNTNHRPEAIRTDDRIQAFDRCAELNLNDDTIVIYDREDPQRWVQSDAAVRLVEVR